MMEVDSQRTDGAESSTTATLHHHQYRSGGSFAASGSTATASSSSHSNHVAWCRTIEYEDAGVSGSHPLAARVFRSLRASEYSSAYATSKNEIFVHGVPVVIDNGSFEFRAGYAIDNDPRLVFRSLVGRPRVRRDGDFVLVGNQLTQGDQYAPQRIKVRSAFEQALVTQFDIMEYLFDYTFTSLGMTSSVPHPIFMTEPVANPNYCRSKMSELLFECYSVPAVGYALSEVCSWHHNVSQNRLESRSNADGDCTGDSLVVNLGYESSTVVPIIDSKPVFEHTTRLSVGGSQLSSYLTHSLSNIQFPQHQQQFNNDRMENIIENFAVVVPDDYSAKLNQMALLYDVNQHRVPTSLPPSHVSTSSSLTAPIILQLPVVEPEDTSTSTADLQHRIERKEMQRQRLRNLMSERKEKKLIEDQAILADWDSVRDAYAQNLMTPSEYLKQLKRRTFADEQDFLTHYEKLKKSVTARLSGEKPEDVAAAAEAAMLAKLSLPDTELYPLLFRPDAELTPDEMKEKSKQKRAKAIAELQLQRRREKEAKLMQEKQQKEIEQQEFEANPEAFLSNLQKQKEAIIASREERIRAESDTTGRRTLASKKRMALLASMGGSGGSIEAIEKNARKDKLGFAKEASFGMNDNDWNVYEEVRMPGSDGARNESDEEREAISRIEGKIAQYDTNPGKSQMKTVSPEEFQVSLWVDRVKLPELFFQPTAMLGIDESGLGEILRRTFNRLSTEHANRVAKHVHVCGGSSLFPNLSERILHEIRQIRPMDSQLLVRPARDPQLDAWRGAALLCRTTPFSNLFFTRTDWEEKGADYLKEHAASNIHVVTPADEPPEVARKRKREAPQVK